MYFLLQTEAQKARYTLLYESPESPISTTVHFLPDQFKSQDKSLCPTHYSFIRTCQFPFSGLINSMILISSLAFCEPVELSCRKAPNPVAWQPFSSCGLSPRLCPLSLGILSVSVPFPTKQRGVVSAASQGNLLQLQVPKPHPNLPGRSTNKPPLMCCTLKFNYHSPLRCQVQMWPF